MRRWSLLAATALLLGLAPQDKASAQSERGAPLANPAAGQEPFEVDPANYRVWLEGLRAEAAAKGISPGLIDRTLGQVQPIPRVVELDRRQAEFTQTFWTYISRAVSDNRIEEGRERLAENRRLLERIGARYGVQPRFLVAFWGLETNYGANMGGYPVVDALVTLAYEGRRGDFFRAELLDALRILDQGHIEPGRMFGSWAGAMGQPQFLPSTFLNHAVDENGDGRKDIWNSLPDVFGSAANYLRAIGWKDDELWGREVRLPEGFDLAQATLEVKRSVNDWAALGVRRADGRPLPSSSIEGSVILPGGYRGPAFLVYDNFRSILEWNRSILYAVAVGLLSDRIDGEGPLVAQAPADDRPLARGEVIEMQRHLLALGFDAGEPDGVIGSQTRAALREFQLSAGLPPDGYPTAEMLSHLRRAGPRLTGSQQDG